MEAISLMDYLIGIVLLPLFAWLIHWLGVEILKLIPEGRIKRILMFRPWGGTMLDAHRADHCPSSDPKRPN